MLRANQEERDGFGGILAPFPGRSLCAKLRAKHSEWTGCPLASVAAVSIRTGLWHSTQ